MPRCFTAIRVNSPQAVANNGWGKFEGQPPPEIGALAKRIAWKTMRAEPMSGLRKQTDRKLGDNGMKCHVQIGKAVPGKNPDVTEFLEARPLGKYPLGPGIPGGMPTSQRC